MAPIGIISGTVLHGTQRFAGLRKERLVNEFGTVTLRVSSEVAFVSRHDDDAGGYILPHQIKHPANFTALKQLGVREVIAVNSTGSLKRDIPPGSVVVPDDFILTANTPTLISNRPVHITPELSAALRSRLIESARACGIAVVDGGTYWQTEGPRFETKAEIRMMAHFADLVGMTMASEAIIARELDIAYAAICSVDNYGNGIAETPLTMEQVLEGARKNRETLMTIVQHTIERSQR